MTKSFTAMAILKLRDEGKLGLDDPAENYVAELKNIRYPTADAPRISIRHLLTHGAGFPEDNPWGDRQLADTDKDLVDFINQQIIFSNSPGVAYEYSNLGFALLGKIITAVSGRRYQDYIRENIWQPLGMNNSEWEYSRIDPKLLAHGYRWLNEKWNDEPLLPDTPDGSWGAMGSMITSIDEFAEYMKLHLSAWPASNYADKGPLKRSSIREMHHPWRINSFNTDFKYSDGRTCPSATSYCYGLNWLKDCEGRVFVGHSGGLPGFGSQWRILPDYGIGVVAFANRTYAPITGINLRVLDTLIKLAGLETRKLPASTILDKRKAELMKVLPDWEKAEASGIFAENFFPDNPIDSLRKQAQNLFSKAGRIVSVKELKAQNQLRGTFLIDGENTDIEIYFTLSPENPPLIQEYRMKEVKVP
jgi:CubicO group peptidase (beta-lactamase class C family)